MRFVLSIGWWWASLTVAFPQPRQASLIIRQKTSLASAKDDEIARLQEQIRQLQEEAEQEAAQAEDLDEAKFRKVVEKRRLEKVAGKDMLLTEGALIGEKLLDQEESDAPGMVPAVVGTIALLAVLAFFAQVPVGQEELSRYSNQAGPTVSRTIDLGDLNPDQKTAGP